jgi:predicted Fe-S protein YdhL (DUF1289 family)
MQSAAIKTRENPMVESPCVKLCALNADDVCVGCGRTRAEIGAWSTLPDAMKEAVNRRARQRRAEGLKPAPPIDLKVRRA